VREDPRPERVGVFGIGNVLASDDAFGPHLVRVLQSKYVIPDRVSLRDMGTPGLGFHTELLDLDALILLDTVKAAGRPGDLLCFDREEVIENRPQERVGPHDPSLKEALITVDLVGSGPRLVRLIGVIPVSVETAVGLSLAVEEALPEAEARVLETLSAWGVEASPRCEPLSPEIWWAPLPP
jgi:hydrogenase maturation protease